MISALLMTLKQVASQETVSTPTEQRAPAATNEVVSFFKTVIILIIAAVLLRECVIEAFKIPSGSMIPTLQEGDHILVSKLSYGLRMPFVKETFFQYAAPERGDVVVFTRPDEIGTKDDESSINIIKRVIGLPGDFVEVRGSTVFINQKPLGEPYARWDLGGIVDGYFGPVEVPAGHVILLGDNRDHSRDSRFWKDPFLPINRIKGRALVIYFSWYDFWRVGRLIR